MQFTWVGGLAISKKLKALKQDCQPEDIDSLVKKLKADGVITDYKERKTGRVKFYNIDKGWGFIKSGDETYFLHYKQLRYNNPKKGEGVIFTPGLHEGKPVALHVQPEDDRQTTGVK